MWIAACPGPMWLVTATIALCCALVWADTEKAVLHSAHPARICVVEEALTVGSTVIVDFHGPTRRLAIVDSAGPVEVVVSYLGSPPRKLKVTEVACTPTDCTAPAGRVTTGCIELSQTVGAPRRAGIDPVWDVLFPTQTVAAPRYTVAISAQPLFLGVLPTSLVATVAMLLAAGFASVLGGYRIATAMG